MITADDIIERRHLIPDPGMMFGFPKFFTCEEYERNTTEMLAKNAQRINELTTIIHEQSEVCGRLRHQLRVSQWCGLIQTAVVIIMTLRAAGVF